MTGNLVRIERGLKKGVSIGNGFSYEGSRITTSANRAVLFNVLLNRFYIDFSKVSCADFCCGSGIVGFEMLSLGAMECLFIDSDRKKLANVSLAINKLNFNANAVCCYLPNIGMLNKQFDIIFFDPPYDNNFCNETIKEIFDKNLITNNGYLIVETKQDINTYNFKTEHIKYLKNGAKFVFLKKYV